MEKGVAITGMGIISSIGNNVEKNLESLLSRRHGISYPEILETKHTHLPVGEIKFSNDDLKEILKLNPGHSLTRAGLLGAIAAKEAIMQSQIKDNQLKDTGFISGSSVGGMDFTEKFYKEFEGSPENRRFIQAQHPGFTTAQIADYLNIKGFISTPSTACSSSANAIMLGARLIKAGKLKRVVVGGTDCLSRFTLNGFNSLKILSSEKCQPFDDKRSGLNLGEGAAYLVLEAEDVLKEKKVLARITGYGNSNDAHHQTASSETGEGAFLAMQEALKAAGIFPGEIDYINAHGTATKNNDLSESIAIKRIFKENLPPVSSTKAFTGHTLAAAGSVEAVFCLLSLSQNRLFPNLNFKEPMQERGLKPLTDIVDKNLRNILSNSFGFGGNCSSLIFSRYEG